MRYKYIHILAALFLMAGMTVQFIVSYRQARRQVQERIDLKMQIAQEKLLFEIYDAYEAQDQLAADVEENLTSPEELLNDTRDILNRYPSLYTCYAAFPEYYYPEKGKWYCPCSYRLGDSLLTIKFGDKHHDYFSREWYQGALCSGDEGYWSQPYSDEDFEETILTYSNDLRDENGDLICVTALDFSLSWMKRLLEQFKPFDEAVLALYTSSGTTLTSSGTDSHFNSVNWITSRQRLDPIDETARAVVLLSCTPDGCTVFQPYNTHTRLLGDVLMGLEKIGTPIRFVETQEFVSRMHQAALDPQKASLLTTMLAYQGQAKNKQAKIVGRNNEYTAQVLLRLGFRWSEPDSAYVGRMLTAISQLGFFDV